MVQRKKVAPENCPGHKWIALRTVKICWHCTIAIQILEGLSPEEIEEEEKYKARAKLTKQIWRDKKLAQLPDLAKLPDGVIGLLPAGTGELWTYSVDFVQGVMPPYKFKADLRDACKEWAGKKDLPFYRAAQVFYASTLVGPDIARIAEYLDMKVEWVTKIGQRYVDSGIWKDGKIYTDSIGHKPDISPEVEMESVLIIMCGMGDIRRGHDWDKN